MSAKIKLTGVRSLKSKLRRMSSELADDSGRVRADHSNHMYLADELAVLSRQLGALAKRLED